MLSYDRGNLSLSALLGASEAVLSQAGPLPECPGCSSPPISVLHVFCLLVTGLILLWRVTAHYWAYVHWAGAGLLLSHHLPHHNIESKAMG